MYNSTSTSELINLFGYTFTDTYTCWWLDDRRPSHQLHLLFACTPAASDAVHEKIPDLANWTSQYSHRPPVACSSLNATSSSPVDPQPSSSNSALHLRAGKTKRSRRVQHCPDAYYDSVLGMPLSYSSYCSCPAQRSCFAASRHAQPCSTASLCIMDSFLLPS